MRTERKSTIIRWRRNWNGSAWSIVSRAKNAPANTLLEGVSALSPNDAWAVGKAPYPNNQAVFEHWNGKKWTASVEDGPSQLESSNNATANQLLGVIAIEGGGLWAVGNGANPPTCCAQTLTVEASGN
jgi:hypothetical protein